MKNSQVKWYLRSAESGFPKADCLRLELLCKAQYTVGMLYLEGTGGELRLSACL